MIGVESFCTGASTVVMSYELKRGPECLMLHDMVVKLLFFFVVTVEFVLKSFDVLGYETNVSELGHRCIIIAKDAVELFDCFVVENDVP
jgi:hypothetical protein